MLDIKFVRENLEAVQANIANRGLRGVDPERAVSLYARRNEALQALEGARAERNVNAAAMKGKLEPEARQALIEKGREIKEQLAALEAEVAALDPELDAVLKLIPNMTHPAVPVGHEGEGTVLRVVGEKPTFDFEPKDHIAIGAELDLIDFENAARVAGQKFYYLKNEGALLELALINYAMGKLVARGWTPYLTPDLARESILEGIGFNPRGEGTQVYSVAETDLCLIGTAEIPLGGLMSGQILAKESLPLRIVGFSHCFRTEAGAAGAESRGLYRVHQFSKVEMFAYCAPEQSEALHAEIRDLEIEIFSELGLHFRVVDIPTGDLGAPAYRKFDLEAWMPGRGDFGEVTSTSNCTDYQSRRLGIRYRENEKENRFAHTLNGTAVAVSRALLAVLENGQQADGSVVIPAVLRPFMYGQEVIRKEKPWGK